MSPCVSVERALKKSLQGGRVAVEISEVPPHGELEQEWRGLEAVSEASFFLTWEWVGLWLRMLPQGVCRRLARVREGSRTVGLAILCEGVRRRSGFVTSRALFLHTTGQPELDEITLEYNGVLAERGLEAQVIGAILEQLAAEKEWEEIYFDGWHRQELLPHLGLPGAKLLVERSRPYRYVDLEALRRESRPYIDTLGSRSRYRIKRTLREFKAGSTPVFEVAGNPEEALRYLAELKRLHQETWRARGLPGAFANEFFDRFHTSLVEAGSAKGFVQMLRLSEGRRAVGLLYNFVHRGHVYVYQTGFDYSSEAGGSKWSPGLLCHAYAIEHNRNLGYMAYDLMAGDSRYKRELAASTGEMSWLVLQRPRLKFRLHELLRSARRRLRARAAPRPAQEDEAPS